MVLARPDVALNAHPAGDLSGGAAHVDVVALVAALCEPLDDGGLPTTRGELVGECRPGNARRRRLAREDSSAVYVAVGHGQNPSAGQAGRRRNVTIECPRRLGRRNREQQKR